MMIATKHFFRLVACSALLGAASAETLPEEMMEMMDMMPSSVMQPIACDTDHATDVGSKFVLREKLGDFDVEIKVECKGTAAGVLFVDVAPEGALGLSINSDDGTFDYYPDTGGRGNSLCFSFFLLIGEATKYKSECSGRGFKFKYSIEMMGLHQSSPSSRGKSHTSHSLSTSSMGGGSHHSGMRGGTHRSPSEPAAHTTATDWP